MLYLDVGNSFIKAVYKYRNEWDNHIYSFGNEDELATWISDLGQSVDSCIISGVVSDKLKRVKSVIRQASCIELKVSDVPSTHLDYDTPETLGIDRFLACLGAYGSNERAAVVIDAGTACTVDFMDGEGVFRGGVIMPGLQIIEQALRTYTPELPGVEKQLPSSWPGKSTHESLQWGIVGMFSDTLYAHLHRYSQTFGEYDVYVTGGGASTVKNLLDMDMQIDEYLVFKGMEAFLELFLNKG